MKMFYLPDLGEGLPDAEIVKWHVKVGDTIQIDELLVSMETAKAVVDIPSPFAGKIAKLHGVAGNVINTGDLLVEFDVNGISESDNLIRDTGAIAGKIEVGNTVVKEHAMPVLHKVQSTNKAIPAVRALAKRLQVDLTAVIPTGPNLTITAKDVEKTAYTLQLAGKLELLKGVRRSMAQAMTRAYAEVVPVTVTDNAILKKWSANEDITVRVIQAIVAGLKAELALNAWFDGSILGRRLISSINLGIACDTPDGLFVPIIESVADLTKNEIRAKLNMIKRAVHSRTISQEQLRGATFSLSNFGKFAGRYASLVVVPPQVAILGVGCIREEVVAISGDVQVCRVLPLSLCFDHRACTGGEATRCLGAIIDSLSS